MVLALVSNDGGAVPGHDVESTAQNLNTIQPNTTPPNTTEPPISESACDESASGEFAPHWFAAYTQPNHEKSVARQMSERAIPHYLPLYESVRQWKDRKIRLDLPLFPGYVFVRMPLQNRLTVIQVPSLIRLVGFGGEPVTIPEAELMAIRTCLDHDCKLQPHHVLRAGQRVRITRGPLTGIEGILVRKKGISRLVLSIGLITRAVAVEVNIGEIEAVPVPASRAPLAALKS
jgi:transcription antitermination factor NusG